MIKTKVIQTRAIPLKSGIVAITLFGLVFTRDRRKVNRYVLNHELIHCRQQLEWLYLPFFIIYLAEWLWYMATLRNWNAAYRAISFEREAYENENDLSYLEHRPLFANFRHRKKG